MAELSNAGKYLRQYLQDNNKDVEEMMCDLNVNRYYLSDIAHGKVKPTQNFYDAFVKKYEIDEKDQDSLKATFGIKS